MAREHFMIPPAAPVLPPGLQDNDWESFPPSVKRKVRRPVPFLACTSAAID